MAQKYSIFIILFIFIASCKQESNNESIIPSISIKKVEQLKLNGKDSAVNFIIAYADGDGDIGLNTDDTIPPFNESSPFYNNLIIEIYEVVNGKASKIPKPGFPGEFLNYNDRIINLTPTGKSKSISGEIQMLLKASPSAGVFPDSMYYSFQLYDRALNKSNKAQTPVLRFEF